MIVNIGKRLELAEEIEVTIYINGLPSHIMCSPGHLDELALGFVVSEGIVSRDSVDSIDILVKGSEVFVDVESNSFVLELRSSGCVGVFREGEVLPNVKAKEKFTFRELEDSLRYIETDEYKKTRGYHSCALVGKEGMILRRLDVGRHNAVDKAIGAGLKQKVDLSRAFLLLSGRISRGIVAKAVRAGIPLLVSKASILNSAIDVCEKTGLAVVSFASGIAIPGESIIF